MSDEICGDSQNENACGECMACLRVGMEAAFRARAQLWVECERLRAELVAEKKAHALTKKIGDGFSSALFAAEARAERMERALNEAIRTIQAASGKWLLSSVAHGCIAELRAALGPDADEPAPERADPSSGNVFADLGLPNPERRLEEARERAETKPDYFADVRQLQDEIYTRARAPTPAPATATCPHGRVPEEDCFVCLAPDSPDPRDERIRVLEEALQTIAEWSPDSFPRVYDSENPGRVLPFGLAWGSNGERDFMREVARKALASGARAGRGTEPTHG